MKRLLLVAIAATLLTVPAFAAVPSASAAPSAGAAPSASATPPNAHPSLANSGAKPGAGALPPGHPAPANPHGGFGNQPRDESAPSAEIPKGSVDVTIVDAHEQPLANTQVRLGVLFQKISEGESRSERFLQTDASGHVRFDGLQVGSDYNYRVTVASGAAVYSSTPFGLAEASGQRVKLHILPVTRDINAALIGLRGFIYIETRDDVFSIDVLYRVFNVGATTWVPDNVVLRLPSGFKALRAQESMNDTTVEEVEGRGARLKGTFTPGQHDLAFRFQLPKTGESSAHFEFGTLPHVAELRVIAEASTQMGLEVDGFEKPQADTSQAGKRVLVTRRVVQRADENFNGASVTLTGLPVPGPGRWYAVLIAAGLAGLGFAAARGDLRLDADSEQKQNRDAQAARELLLAEIVEVERARRAGDLGPRAYSDARKTLLDALTRLGGEALTLARPKRRKPA